MPTRYDPPARVNVGSYILFGIAAIQVLHGLLLKFYPKPELQMMPLPPVLLWIEVVHAAALCVCAWYIPREKNWARFASMGLYLFYPIVMFVFWLDVEFIGWLGLTFGFLAVILLITPRSNAFFAGKNPEYEKMPGKARPGLPRGQEDKYNY